MVNHSLTYLGVVCHSSLDLRFRHGSLGLGLGLGVDLNSVLSNNSNYITLETQGELMDGATIKVTTLMDTGCSKPILE